MPRWVLETDQAEQVQIPSHPVGGDRQDAQPAPGEVGQRGVRGWRRPAQWQQGVRCSDHVSAVRVRHGAPPGAGVERFAGRRGWWCSDPRTVGQHVQCDLHRVADRLPTAGPLDRVRVR